jgi:DNA-directed RNA polymerase subunit omega
MALDHDTMITPPIEGLLDQVDSKFSLVTLAARRARNINSYFNQLGDGLGHMIPPQVSSTSRKPLSIAFEEISVEKIQWTEAPEAEELDVEFDAEAEAQAMADAKAEAELGHD